MRSFCSKCIHLFIIICYYVTQYIFTIYLWLLLLLLLFLKNIFVIQMRSILNLLFSFIFLFFYSKYWHHSYVSRHTASFGEKRQYNLLYDTYSIKKYVCISKISFRLQEILSICEQVLFISFYKLSVSFFCFKLLF